MAVKMLKYPRKPKRNASVATMERYLDRVRDIDKENARRKALNKKAESLRNRIAGIGRAK